MKQVIDTAAELDVPLNQLGATAAANAISARRISALDLLDACYAQIDRYDGAISAWACFDREGARADAVEIDRKVRSGAVLGPCAGIPVGIKDIFNTYSMPCQMGSPIWAGFTPGNDARVVHYLRMADAIFPGKTVTAEFAVHAPGPTENPHRRDFTPGTSSSGSAAAVAAYMVPVALGTQTAGSIIRPASYCGVYGMKPSFGVVPRTGMLKTTDTLDTVGWFARSVNDLALMFDTIRVKGLDFPIMDAAFSDEARQRPIGRPWRVALVRGPKWHEASAHTRSAVERYAEKLSRIPSVEVFPVDTPTEFTEAHAVHATIYNRALAYYFKEEFAQHTLVSRNIYEIIEAGNRLTPADYYAALKRQSQIAAVADRFLCDYDVALDIATAGEAMEGLDSVDRPDHALIWTLCRLPAVSVPALTGPSGLPLGVQFFARRYNDPLLLEFLAHLDRNDFAPRRTRPEPPMAGLLS